MSEQITIPNLARQSAVHNQRLNALLSRWHEGDLNSITDSGDLIDLLIEERSIDLRILLERRTPPAQAPEGYALICRELLERFPEINPANYGQDEVDG